MPETSTPTLTPDATTKVPAFQNNNPGNVELGALKSFILNQAGLANGLATLDENGKLNAAQIPANLDDVLVYGSYALLPAVGESGKLYITTDVNGSYYWNGTSYQMLNNSFVRYRGTVSSLPSNPVTGDWFIAASTFTEGGVTYTSGAIYLYNGSSWDDATAVFGQFVRKSDISQTIGPEIDKVPSNAAVNGAINAIKGRKLTNISASSFDEFLLKLATALHNEYNPLDTFMCWLDWSGNLTFLVQGVVQNTTSVFFTVCTYVNYPSYCVLVLDGTVYKNAL